MSLTDRYVDYFELYNEQLSSTKIVLVKDLVEERVSTIQTFSYQYSIKLISTGAG